MRKINIKDHDLTAVLYELKKARDKNYDQHLKQVPDVATYTLGEQVTRLWAGGYEAGMSAAIDIILCQMENAIAKG